jgi:hypothetical protein
MRKAFLKRKLERLECEPEEIQNRTEDKVANCKRTGVLESLPTRAAWSTSRSQDVQCFSIIQWNLAVIPALVLPHFWVQYCGIIQWNLAVLPILGVQYFHISS